MNKKNVMSFVKKLTAGVLAVGMVVVGVAVAPKQAEAEGTITIPDKVDYVRYDNAQTYWNAEPKTAPMKDGYVFGGWFKNITEESEKTERTEIFDDNGTTVYYEPLTEVTGSAYAKFVPAQVLSVKAQNGVDEGKNPITQASDISEDNPMWMRVMTSQDSKNYKKIGFDIYLANKTQPTNSADGTKILETDKVFSGLYEGDNTEPTPASAIFCSASNYVCVWKLNKIDTASNAEKIIYVRPYWYTMDGTKVNGLAKYVHIEDEYEGYVSVPVNVSRTDGIAAGSVTMNCSGLTLTQTDGKVYLNEQEVLFEAGRVFDNMRFNGNGETIKMLGYESDVATDNSSDETIYANIRFKESVLTEDVNFDMTLTKFCNWAEELVEGMKVWDIAYEVKATINE